jgi:hypothetical protein
MLAWSDWLQARLGRSHGIPLEAIYEGLYDWLAARGSAATAREALLADYAASGARGRLAFGTAPHPRPGIRKATAAIPQRQARHLGRG